MSFRKLILDDGTEHGAEVHVEVINEHGNHRITYGPEGIFPHIGDDEYYYMLCNEPGVGDRLEVNGMRLQLGTFMRDHYFHTTQRVRENTSITV